MILSRCINGCRYSTVTYTYTLLTQNRKKWTQNLLLWKLRSESLSAKFSKCVGDLHYGEIPCFRDMYVNTGITWLKQISCVFPVELTPTYPEGCYESMGRIHVMNPHMHGSGIHMCAPVVSHQTENPSRAVRYEGRLTPHNNQILWFYDTWQTCDTNCFWKFQTLVRHT